MTDPTLQALKNRVEGKSRTGLVGLRDFDQGVVETMGATITNDNYFINIQGIDPPPGLAGVPVTFAYPEDIFENYRIPVVIIRRDDISPAMQRYHPGLLQYRSPGNGALSRTVRLPDNTTVSGYSSMEEKVQATPFDISYTISVVARHRGAIGQRNQANRVMDHILRIYQPYCTVRVPDSIGDTRTYEAFMEGISPLDDEPAIAERLIGFALTLRVEAELDLSDPLNFPTAGSIIKLTTRVL